ncbi:Aste57867_25073 [Aphanomyces stellatus]|uniref:Aste57867_25073 protein n=1 Tax=Aphanomyces stellatus TaxID=120398 RepID=A0A485LTI6_9STRA|nr:hypothetical protein As57867_024995 [Aphanomyces stellatus]VFU01704.1 Aste57867_25073 [Aphanomyces stellatus]
MTKKAVVAYPVLHATGCEFMAGNHYIRSGYRIHYSAWDCFSSLFELHNETWNVWTHMLGALLFLLLLVVATVSDYAPIEMTLLTSTNQTSQLALATTATAVPQWPIYVFLGGVMACFVLSALYHLFYVQDVATASVYLQLDYAGIITLIVGCYVPSIYYGFYCDPSLRAIYFSIIALLATAVFVACFVPAVQSRTHVRVAAFLAMILFALVPIVHAIATFGFWDDHVQVMIKPAFMCSLFNVPGLAFYVSRVPERWYPGLFDVYGSSHQWWHLCVVVAAVLYYVHLLEHYAWRCGTTCHLTT